jgi:hypothetical protein
MLRRATFMPADAIRRKMGISRLAGPMVQMILTRSMNSSSSANDG